MINLEPDARLIQDCLRSIFAEEGVLSADPACEPLRFDRETGQAGCSLPLHCPVLQSTEKCWCDRPDDQMKRRRVGCVDGAQKKDGVLRGVKDA